MTNVEVLRFPNANALAADAAERIIRAAEAAVAARGRFLFVLAGGSTPEKTYALLAQSENARRLNWAATTILFGDERMVPPDDTRSNFHMARSALLSKVPVPEKQILRIPTDRAPSACAQTYAAILNFGQPPSASPPVFDLILLGLGDDGHTASLFPGAAALKEQKAWVTWSPPGVLPPPVDRVTMTFPVLNAAREVMFLVAGANKAAPVKEVLEGMPTVEKYPAAGVQPTSGKLTWLLDEAAAALLTRHP
ncbi:MAG: 6-phosphogluconolactonase [Planctomycetes bacterium]|nr:6-phosphogluconolactonase [Planctomycetota bacterium]